MVQKKGVKGKSMILTTPPLGWNTWNTFGTQINEKLLLETADYLADSELKKAGYEYIVIDDGWTEQERGADGRLIPNREKFPHGIKYVADYIHSKGLKMGIYSCCGTLTCGGYPGSYDHEYLDAKTFAEWGVDFIKVDDIARELPHEEEELIMLSEALHSCGREMILSLSPGPALLEKAELYKQVANLWRITADFWDTWELLYAMFERAEKWCVHSGAGHWPDADMLPVGAILRDYGNDGWTKFTEDEQYTMLNLWCIMRSPLMIGGDMTFNDRFTLDLLTNADLLEMLSMARSSHQIFKRTENGTERIVWKAFRSEGGYYICVFNTSETESDITVDLAECELFGKYDIFDIWEKSTETVKDSITAKIPPHGSKAYKLNETK